MKLNTLLRFFVRAERLVGQTVHKVDDDDFGLRELIDINRPADAIFLTWGELLELLFLHAALESAQVDRVRRVTHREGIRRAAVFAQAELHLEDFALEIDVARGHMENLVDALNDSVIALSPDAFAVFLFLLPFAACLELMEELFFASGAVIDGILIDEAGGLIFRFFVFVIVVIVIFVIFVVFLLG